MCEVKDWPYMQDVFAYFGKFKTHPAIKRLNKIIDEGNFNYSVPSNIALQLDNNYVFHGQEDYPFLEELDGNPKVLKFLQELKNFAVETKFDEFYDSHKSFYEKEIKDFKKQMDVEDVLVWMKEFFNADFADKAFLIDLALLFTNGGHGEKIDNKIYHVSDKFVDKDGHVQPWGLNYPVERSEILHEFAHSIVNPLVEKNYSNIVHGNFADLLKNSEDYGSEFSYIAETIIRALQNLYVTDKGDSTAGLDKFNQSCGFDPKVINAVADKLDQFRQNPDRNFEESFVDIANVMSATLKNKESEE